MSKAEAERRKAIGVRVLQADEVERILSGIKTIPMRVIPSGANSRADRFPFQARAVDEDDDTSAFAPAYDTNPSSTQLHHTNVKRESSSDGYSHAVSLRDIKRHRTEL